jgi:hypothetical protein
MSGGSAVARWLGGSSSDESSSSSSGDESSDEDDGGCGAPREQRAAPPPRTAAPPPPEDRAPPLPLNPAASMFAVERSLHRTKHDLRNRLHSIRHDTAFVSAAVALFLPAGFACFANLRQGAWYLDPALRAASGGGTCCFKSSDGHAGQWCFNPRRLNKHVALAAAQRGGVLVVDSTRGGKRLPDALSKTVPIWCAVLNTALARHRRRQRQAQGRARGQNHPPQPEPEPEPEPEPGQREEDDGEWDCGLHVAPMIPPSESAQIADRIEGWVDDLEASGSGYGLYPALLCSSLLSPSHVDPTRRQHTARGIWIARVSNRALTFSHAQALDSLITSKSIECLTITMTMTVCVCGACYHQGCERSEPAL